MQTGFSFLSAKYSLEMGIFFILMFSSAKFRLIIAARRQNRNFQKWLILSYEKFDELKSFINELGFTLDLLEKLSIFH